MNEITKELFDGFMTTFNRKNDVMVGVDHEMQSAQRNFKIIKDVLPCEMEQYTPSKVGKLFGELLNTHELISKEHTSKIIIKIPELLCFDSSVRYRIFVELVPNT